MAVTVPSLPTNGGNTGTWGTTLNAAIAAVAAESTSPADVSASIVAADKFATCTADTTGSTSMRSAWDAACTAALASGKNTVYLPEGTYLAVPDATTGICLSIPSGIKHISGAGRDKTIIQVQSGCGDYVAVMRQSASSDVAGLVIEELTINQNNTGNPVTTGFTLSSPLFQGKARFCVSLTNATGPVTVRRVNCTDMDNINAISVSGTVRDVLIENNSFTMGTVATDHDHSAIYTNSLTPGTQVRIIGNTGDTSDFLSGHNAARTFIETHAGYQVVQHNKSRGYQKGGNLTGIALVSGEGARWSNNDFIDCRFGIMLWSSTYSTNTGPVGLKGVVVRDNLIQLDVAGWASFAGGAFAGQGIFLDASSNLPAHDITVTNNHVFFKAGGYTGLAGDSISMGIEWRRSTAGAIVDRRITITENTIDGPMAAGIRLGTNGDGFTVDRNIIKNVGQASIAAGGALSNGYAVGVFVIGCYTNSSIDGNKVLDDQASLTTSVGLYLYPSATCVNSTAIGNVVPAAFSGKVTAASSSTGFLIRMDQVGKLISTGAALSSSADTVTVTGHGLANGTSVQFAQVITATGVTPATVYYVVGTATNTFQVATTPGGSAVDITTDGTASVIVNTVSLPTGWSAYGSTVVDRTNGITYTQSTSPEGSTWGVASVVQSTDSTLAGISTSVASSYDRRSATSVATLAALTSGTCTVVLVPFTKTATTTKVRWITGTTAGTTMTHQWAALTDLSGNVLAVTADATSAALGASTQFSWAWGSPVTLPSGNYYVHLMVAASTVPTTMGANLTGVATKYAPIITGPGATGQTTPPSVGGALAVPSTTGFGPTYFDLA